MDLKERTKWAIDYISKREGISNTKIGKRLGFTNDTINSYRAKLANPKVDFIIRFCDEFGIDLVWFTKGDGEPFLGASRYFPDVCSESRYEVKKENQSEHLSSVGRPASIYPSLKDRPQENGPIINSVENSLLNLCKLAGIPTNRGWKTVLAKYFGSTSAQLSNCISRNRISKNLIIKINEKGYPSDSWIVRATQEKTSFDINPKELDPDRSFQRLALLAGIKIGDNWILGLANFLEIEPWNIIMSISHGRVYPDILMLAEEKGYSPERWAVSKRSETSEASENGTRFNNMELLKLAEKILRSDTIHATSLAMNIISLTKAVDTETTHINNNLENID